MAEFIAVSSDGRGFTHGPGGERFVPFGANYFDPKTGWAPKIWSRFDEQRVQRQLGQMAQAGLNCIRVFLDIGTLNPAAGQYCEEGFAKVDRLIELSRQAGIRIIFSGPNTWEGRVEHRRGDEYADPEVIGHMLDLWRRIAARWGREPTVMSWDLRNEPMVSHAHRPDRPAPPPTHPRTGLWKQYARRHVGAAVEELPPHEPAGMDRALYGAYIRFQEDLAEQWVARQVQALREAGARQLVTVGLIQWSIPIFLAGMTPYAAFNPRKIAPHLDYMSMHFYPMLLHPDVGLEGELDVQRAYLEVVARAAYVPGKPLVMEEFGWKGGKQVPRDSRAWPQEHQTLWGDIFMEITGRVASGWLNWGYADAAAENADISAASGLWTQDEQLKHWGKRFAEYAALWQRNPPACEPARRRFHLNLTDYLYRHNGHPNYDWLAEQVRAHESDTIEVVFED